MREPERVQSEDLRYWCFISYRHADNESQDREWASWLQQEIERYEVPAELVGTENSRGDRIPERIFPVFRDEESLPAEADLATGIAEALANSRYLIVLCSPKAVESRYVAQEIIYFKRAGKTDAIIAAIISGDPGGGEETQCFPEPLLHPVDDRGNLDTSILTEPIAADFRLRDGSEGFTSAEAFRLSLLAQDDVYSKREIRHLADGYDSQLQLMKLKLIAGILGLPLDVLRDRDRVYQLELSRKRVRVQRWVATGFALIAAVAVAAGVMALDRANLARNARHLSDLDSDALQARLLADEDGRQAQRDIATTLKTFHQSYPGKPLPVSFQSALGSILNEARETARFQMDLEPTHLELLSDGRTIAAISAERLLFFDLTRPSDSPAAPGNLYRPGEGLASRYILGLAALDRDNQLALAFSDGTVEVWIPGAESPRHRWTAHPETAVRFIRFLPGSGRLLTVGSEGEIRFWSRTGEPSDGPYQLPGATPRSLAVDVSGRRMAVLGVGQREWHQVVFDQSGSASSTHRVANGIPTVLEFHPDGKSVALGLENGLVEIWRSDGTISTFTGLTQPVTALTYLESGRILAAAAEDGSIRLWTREGNPFLSPFHGHAYHVVDLAATPDRHFLISADDEGSLRAWDLLGLQVAPPLPAQTAHEFQLAGFCFGATDSELITIDRRGKTVGWHWRTGEISRSTSLSIAYPIQRVVVHPDRSLLAAFNQTEHIEILRTDTLQSVATIAPLTAPPASGRRNKGLVFHPEHPWMYYTENDRILRIAREEDGWRPETLAEFPNKYVYSLNWVEAKEEPLWLVSKGELRSFSESSELTGTTAIPDYLGFYEPGSIWLKDDELRVPLRGGGNGSDGIFLLQVESPKHRLLTRSFAVNHRDVEMLFQSHSRVPIMVSRVGEFAVFADDDRLTPVFQSPNAHPFHVNLGMQQLNGSDVTAVATSYDGIFFWSTAPARWEALLSNRLATGLPTQLHDSLAAPKNLTSTDSPFVPVREQGDTEGVVRVPAGGFQMTVDPDWKPLPATAFNVIGRQIARDRSNRGEHFQLAAAYRLDSPGPANPFLNAVFLVELPRMPGPEDFLSSARFGTDSVFKMIEDAQFLGGLFRFERESIRVQWHPGQSYPRMEGVMNAVYKGDTPVRILGIWVPTDGATVVLAAVASLPEDGSEPRLFAEARRQMETVTIRPQHRIASARLEQVEKEVGKFAASLALEGASKQWHDLHRQTEFAAPAEALKAADELVNLASLSRDSAGSEEERIKWSILLIQSHLRHDTTRQKHAVDPADSPGGTEAANPSSEHDPDQLADFLRQAQQLADDATRIGAYRDRAVSLLVGLYFRRIVGKRFPSDRSIEETVRGDLRNLVPLSDELAGEDDPARFLRIALEAADLADSHPGLMPEILAVLESAIPLAPGRGNAGILLCHHLAGFAAAEYGKEQAVHYWDMAADLSEQYWRSEPKASTGLTVAERLRWIAVERFAIEGLTPGVKQAINRSITILEEVSVIAPDRVSEVDRRIAIRRKLLGQWEN